MANKRVKPSIESLENTSVDVPTQLTLEKLLEDQPNQSVEWSFEPDDIGGDLLGILSKGLYPDPLDCIREYVQNSVDAKAKTVTIKITGNSVIIIDDGRGMALGGLVQARRLGLSNKSQTEDVGFRGIGIYSSFDICNRLLITTKIAGEARSRVLEFNFGEMKALLKTERDAKSMRTSLTQLLSTYTHFKQEDDQIDRHYTIVQLEELSMVHIGQLADHERLRAYMLHNLPIAFAENFPYKDQITRYLEENVPGYNAIRVKLVTDFASPEMILRSNIPNLGEPILDIIRNADKKKIAVYWACFHAIGGQLPNQYAEYRGLVYKVKGFTIGDRSRLRVHFTTAKGTLYDWCTGEVYVIDENVIPNAARNDFEASQEKLQLETAVGDSMNELNGRIAKFQEQQNANKDFTEVSKYLDDLEKKVASLNLDQCSSTHLQLERYRESLKKKQKKTTFGADFVQETMRRTEMLKNIVRQMIDHPHNTSHPISSNGPSVVNTPLPSSPTSAPSKPGSSVPKRASIVPDISSETISTSNSPLPLNPTVSQPSPQTGTTTLFGPAKTLLQICEQSGLEVSGSCIQLLQIIDRSLSSVLIRENYERVLDDLEARLDYEVTGEIESEDE